MLQSALRKHTIACLSVSFAILPHAFTVPALLAQAAPEQVAAQKAEQPAFDVSTIKPNKSGSTRSSSLITDYGTYTGENIDLKSLLSLSFGVRPDLIFGLPSWAESTRFDVSAKVVDSEVKDLTTLTRQQRRAMMQALVTDRFQLKSHMETRTLPVYELMIAKGGVKFKESTATGGRSGISTRNTELTAINSAIANFTNTLSDYLHRAVIDKTGLTGKYDFALKWARDDSQNADVAADAGPSLFTAVQEQLGLRLQSAQGPVQVLVVDQIEQPSEN